jgi:hypothetical protein
MVLMMLPALLLAPLPILLPLLLLLLSPSVEPAKAYARM